MQPFIIFDYDGTLVDSSQDIANAANATRQHFDLEPLTLEKVKGFVGDGMDAFLRLAIPEISESQAGECKKVFSEHYLRVASQTSVPFDGIKDLLDQLILHNFRLGLVSNKPKAMLDAMNRELGLEKYFCTTLGGECLPERKPSPEPLLIARQRAGFDDKTPLIMVGDGAQDIAAAKAAGATSIWVSWGMQVHQPAGSHYRADHPRDVWHAIQQWIQSEK